MCLGHACLPCWKVSSLRAGIMYDLLIAGSITLSSVPGTEQADTRSVPYCPQYIKLSLIRITYNVLLVIWLPLQFLGLIPAPLALPFCPTKTFAVRESLGLLAFAHAVPSNWHISPPLFACQITSHLSRLI